MRGPYSFACQPCTFASRTGVRRRRGILLGYHARGLQNKDRSECLVVGTVEKHRAAGAGSKRPAFAWLWHPCRPRGSVDGRHSDHATRDRACRSIPRGGGTCVRHTVSQHGRLDVHDGNFHCANSLGESALSSTEKLVMTQVESLAKYAARASFADLSSRSREQLPVHILDSLGCCIAALGSGPIEASRAQVTDFGNDGPCTLIGGGKANPIFAAFWHTALVRYVDFMDNFLAPIETCHTADNFGVALTAAEYIGGSGRDLMLGVALSYTVQSRFVDHANFMTRGFDHTAQLAFSLNAAAGRLLGMSEVQIANAIAMAAASDASFAVIRAKPLSQWKGLASAQSALGAMNALFLARHGVEGPLQVIEGTNGIDNLLHMQVQIDWDKEGYEGVLESTIKMYNAMIHTQSAVHCMVELVRQNKFDPGKVVSIQADVTRITYDFAGGGLYGMDKVVRTKEQADHNLPYLLAVALLDGNVMPAQFEPDRIARADVQQLLKKVSVRPNHEYTDEYPRKMPAKITVHLKDGKVIEHEVHDYPGLASHPFTWEESVEMLDSLVIDRIDDGLSREIKDALRSRENIQVNDLTNLLGQIKVEVQPAVQHTAAA